MGTPPMMLHWTDNPMEKAERLKDSIKKRILKKASGKGARVIARKMKTMVPEKTGAMRVAIGTKTLSGRKYGVQGTAIIGAKTKYKRIVGTYVRGKKKGRPIVVRPSKYWRLVDRGHFGKHPAGPKGFMQDSLDAAGHEAANEIFMSVSDDISKELRKAKK